MRNKQGQPGCPAHALTACSVEFHLSKCNYWSWFKLLARLCQAGLRFPVQKLTALPDMLRGGGFTLVATVDDVFRPAVVCTIATKVNVVVLGRSLPAEGTDSRVQ